MDEKKLKISAAIAAVMAYIEEEPFMERPEVEEVEQTPPAPSMWSVNGRQTQMQLRNMMQLKAFQ